MMASFGDTVWNRRGLGGSMELPKNLYAGLIGLWTTLGIASSAAAASVSMSWQLTGGQMLLLSLGAFVVSLLGIFISMGSDHPIVSFIGYMLVTVPFGFMVGPVVAIYTIASVFKVLAVTSGVTIALGIVGAIYPKSLESWGIFLFGGLLILILAMFFVPLMGFFGLPVEGALTWIDWIAVFLFSGYVIYDMNRAMRLPRTLDNSIDAAVAIYLDFANLFLHLLRIMGNSSSSSD